MFLINEMFHSMTGDNKIEIEITPMRNRLISWCSGDVIITTLSDADARRLAKSILSALNEKGV